MSDNTKTLVKRLLACLLAGVVLAIMIGPQEGTLTDFGISFRQGVLRPRIILFLAIGVLIFVGITFWPLVRPYIRRPGVIPLAAGLITVLISLTVMNWYDPLSAFSATPNAKLNRLRKVVDKTTSGLDATTKWFIASWGAWTLLGVAVILVAACIITRLRPLGYAAAAVGVAGAALAWLSHQDVVDLGNQNNLGHDHSLGAYAAVTGFLILAGAGLVAALSQRDAADTRAFAARVLEWRPGLPFAAIAVVLGVLAFTMVCWFGPLSLNWNFSAAGNSDNFPSYAISELTRQYLSWLGLTLFAVTAAVSLAATYLAHRLLAFGCAVLGLAGVIFTFLSIRSMTEVAAKVAPDKGSTWQNLGVGGYMACLVFTLFVAAGVQAAVAAKPKQMPVAESADPTKKLPFTRLVDSARTARGRAAVVALLGLAIFYPPMLPANWQSTLVAQIGVYLLLALGLNVVVGWAGLLDLGYIAFYEVGAYTTAYFGGRLPTKPPDWLTLKPLETIPFSIIACLIAGVILGAPTLRLRGDYLAIVTLGFGEIIQLMGVNDFAGITGGTTHAPTIPHPKINFLGIKVTWGQDYLPYWYLLLVMLVVVIVLFWRLEGSRLGRAWAAIREDEVAAQASGVNTLRVKLLAFAIGASTSALAGTFYASQVGFFDPTIFTLQASILIVAYVVFGGMGSILGAMAGAAVLTWLPEFLKDQVPASDRPLWVGALVLAMMIFRPEGLIPERRRKAELAGLDDASSSEVRAVPAAEGL